MYTIKSAGVGDPPPAVARVWYDAPTWSQAVQQRRVLFDGPRDAEIDLDPNVIVGPNPHVIYVALGAPGGPRHGFTIGFWLTRKSDGVVVAQGERSLPGVDRYTSGVNDQNNDDSPACPGYHLFQGIHVTL